MVGCCLCHSLFTRRGAKAPDMQGGELVSGFLNLLSFFNFGIMLYYVKGFQLIIDHGVR